eukprot:13258785-Ditylum_brightwellii.AAC.1
MCHVQTALCNKLHLNKSWETPAAKGPFRDYIGQFGTVQGNKDILDGIFDSNKSEEMHEVNYWLKHHAPRVVTDREIQVEMSLDDYKCLMNEQTESISSSPSGWHYGHYKAILDHEKLCLVHAQMMTMPFLGAFTPSKWEKAIDCMLKKDLGTPKLVHLCTIVIVK